MNPIARRFLYLIPGVLALAGLTLASSGTVALAASADLITPIVTVTAPTGATTGSVDYQVNVADPTDSGVPTGTVTITDGIGGSCTTGTLDGSGNGDCAIEEPAGTYTVVGTYTGDSNYSSATGQTSETVVPATPTVAVQGASGAVTGPVSYSVTVSGPTGAVVPTGTVTVSDGTGGTCTTPTLSGTGTGSCSISEVALDSPYSVTATYNSDTNYTTAQSNSTTETVGEETPTAVITGPSPATAGEVTYIVTITGKTGATTAPSGTVLVNAEDESSGNTNTTCNATLVPNGNVGSGSCSIASTAGTYFLTDTFTTDGNYAGTHSHLTLVVHVAPVTLTLTTKSNPAPAGSAGTAKVAYTATVTSAATGIGPPTGDVLISDGAGGTCTVKSLKNGAGHCTITEALGSYSVSASYSGDGNYASAAATFTQNVATKTTTVASVTGSPVAPGNSVTLSATVTATSSGAAVPSGSIVFVVNGVAQSPVTLVGGTASLSYEVASGAKKGNEKVTAEFQSSDGETWIDSSGKTSIKVT